MYTSGDTIDADYIAWVRFQRRAETFCAHTGCRLRYMPSTARVAWAKPTNYLLNLAKSIRIARRSPLLFVQIPPNPAALIAVLGGRTKIVLDIHNGLFESTRWAGWPLFERVLSRADANIVHNEEIAVLARATYPKCRFFVMNDFLPDIPPFNPFFRDRFGNYALLSGSLGDDEPLPLYEALISQTPELTFVLTGRGGARERLAAKHRNVTRVGHVGVEDLDRLISGALLSIVVSTRDAVQPSGAIEAYAACTPLFVSKNKTILNLLGDYPYYFDPAADVQSTISSFHKAVEECLLKRTETFSNPDTRELELSLHRGRVNVFNRTINTQLSKVIETL